MRTRRIMFQALAVVAMGSGAVFRATPAEAATKRLCTEYCATYCDANVCDPCQVLACFYTACGGNDGNSYPWDDQCAPR